MTREMLMGIMIGMGVMVTIFSIFVWFEDEP